MEDTHVEWENTKEIGSAKIDDGECVDDDTGMGSSSSAVPLSDRQMSQPAGRPV